MNTASLPEHATGTEPVSTVMTGPEPDMLRQLRRERLIPREVQAWADELRAGADPAAVAERLAAFERRWGVGRDA